MNPEEIKAVIEAILMAADEPVSLKRLCQLFAANDVNPSPQEIQDAILTLQQDCIHRSIELMEVSSGFCFRVKKDYANWVMKLWEIKPQRYTRALLETLALIIYKQPITRAEIEQVRGVSVSAHIIKTLLERNWVKIIGHRDVPGKPALLATTKTFLDYFNLKNLEELPALSELQDLEKTGQQLEIQLQAAIAGENNPKDIKQENSKIPEKIEKTDLECVQQHNKEELTI